MMMIFIMDEEGQGEKEEEEEEATITNVIELNYTIQNNKAIANLKDLQEGQYYICRHYLLIRKLGDNKIEIFIPKRIRFIK